MQAVVVVGKIASGKEQAVKLLRELTGAPIYAGSAIIKSEIILEHARVRMRAISERRSICPPRELSLITRELYREIYLQRAERSGKDWTAREIVRRHFFKDSCQEIIIEGPRDLPDVKSLVKHGGVV